MGYCIIIRGPLGVGKTAIAKELAKRTDGKYISVDYLLSRNKLDRIENGKISAKNFIKVNNIMIKKIKSTQKTCIIDGNFYYKRHLTDLVRNLKNLKKHGVIVFTLKASLKTCIERDSKRKKSYGIPATKAVFRLVSRFGYGIVIDTDNKSGKKIVDEIMKSLNKTKIQN